MSGMTIYVNIIESGITAPVRTSHVSCTDVVSTICISSILPTYVNPNFIPISILYLITYLYLAKQSNYNNNKRQYI